MGLSWLKIDQLQGVVREVIFKKVQVMEMCSADNNGGNLILFCVLVGHYRRLPSFVIKLEWSNPWSTCVACRHLTRNI